MVGASETKLTFERVNKAIIGTWKYSSIRSGKRNLFEIFRHAELMRVRIPAPGALVNGGHELHKVLEQARICYGKCETYDSRTQFHSKQNQHERHINFTRKHTRVHHVDSAVELCGNGRETGRRRRSEREVMNRVRNIEGLQQCRRMPAQKYITIKTTLACDRDG